MANVSSLGWARWAGPPARFGQDPAAPPTDGGDGGGFTVDDLKKGLGKITPTLLLVGIATGAAFAIGSGLASRYVFREVPGRRRR